MALCRGKKPYKVTNPLLTTEAPRGACPRPLDLPYSALPPVPAKNAFLSLIQNYRRRHFTLLLLLIFWTSVFASAGLFSVFPPTHSGTLLCRLDRVSCLALRCDSSSRAGQAGPGSKRHVLALGTGTTPGAGPRQTTDRGSRYHWMRVCTPAHP